jgi:pantoate--beta-alanine ligase
MQVFNEIAPLKAFLRDQKHAGRTIGLVPTMGALHEGHLALVQASKAENDLTVATIFVNPTQFNNPADLEKYPRTLDKDRILLEKVECDILFSPEPHAMYEAETLVRFDFGHLDKVMEGRFRPGHFSGVALVVSKLFNITEPDRAYFGQKDWQQFVIISQLARELKFNLELVSIPTFREADGLAMSSRNARLKGKQRDSAPAFFQALQFAKKALKAGRSFEAVSAEVRRQVEMTDDITLEYFEIADSENLNLIDDVKAANRPIMCIAGFVGEVRLIDNMFLD